MFFDIDESLTSSECEKQIQFNLQQMKRLDSEISVLRKSLNTIPCWDCPEPENRDLATSLSNKIEYLSDCADNYERQVDYWQTQKCYALSREKNIENTTFRFTEIQRTSEPAQVRTSLELYYPAGSMSS